MSKLLFALLLATGAAHAYPTLDSAAKAAFAATVRCNVEYGGLLYFDNGEYFYTKAVTDNLGNEVTLRGSFPKTARLVGLYHTHPGMTQASDAFSLEDLKVADRAGVPSYVLALSTGSIHLYRPGKDKVRLARYEVSYRGTILHDR